MNKILSKSKSLIALLLAAVLVFGDLPATGALGLGAIEAKAETSTGTGLGGTTGITDPDSTGLKNYEFSVTAPATVYAGVPANFVASASIGGESADISTDTNIAKSAGNGTAGGQTGNEETRIIPVVFNDATDASQELSFTWSPANIVSYTIDSTSNPATVTEGTQLVLTAKVDVDEVLPRYELGEINVSEATGLSVGGATGTASVVAKDSGETVGEDVTDFTWSSSDPGVFTVSTEDKSTVTITPVAKGAATLKVVYQGLQATADIEIGDREYTENDRYIVNGTTASYNANGFKITPVTNIQKDGSDLFAYDDSIEFTLATTTSTPAAITGDNVNVFVYGEDKSSTPEDVKYRVARVSWGSSKYSVNLEDFKKDSVITVFVDTPVTVTPTLSTASSPKTAASASIYEYVIINDTYYKLGQVSDGTAAFEVGKGNTIGVVASGGLLLSDSVLRKTTKISPVEVGEDEDVAYVDGEYLIENIAANDTITVNTYAAPLIKKDETVSSKTTVTIQPEDGAVQTLTSVGKSLVAKPYIVTANRDGYNVVIKYSYKATAEATAPTTKTYNESTGIPLTDIETAIKAASAISITTEETSKNAYSAATDANIVLGSSASYEANALTFAPIEDDEENGVYSNIETGTNGSFYVEGSSGAFAEKIYFTIKNGSQALSDASGLRQVVAAFKDKDGYIVLKKATYSTDHWELSTEDLTQGAEITIYVDNIITVTESLTGATADYFEYKVINNAYYCVGNLSASGTISIGRGNSLGAILTPETDSGDRDYIAVSDSVKINGGAYEEALALTAKTEEEAENNEFDKGEYVADNAQSGDTLTIKLYAPTFVYTSATSSEFATVTVTSPQVDKKSWPLTSGSTAHALTYKDYTFTVKADDTYAVDKVEWNLSGATAKTELTATEGVYTLTKDVIESALKGVNNVSKNIEITVTTKVDAFDATKDAQIVLGETATYATPASTANGIKLEEAATATGRVRDDGTNLFINYTDSFPASVKIELTDRKTGTKLTGADAQVFYSVEQESKTVYDTSAYSSGWSLDLTGLKQGGKVTIYVDKFVTVAVTATDSETATYHDYKLIDGVYYKVADTSDSSGVKVGKGNILGVIPAHTTKIITDASVSVQRGDLKAKNIASTAKETTDTVNEYTDGEFLIPNAGLNEAGTADADTKIVLTAYDKLKTAEATAADNEVEIYFGGERIANTSGVITIDEKYGFTADGTIPITVKLKDTQYNPDGSVAEDVPGTYIKVKDVVATITGSDFTISEKDGKFDVENSSKNNLNLTYKAKDKVAKTYTATLTLTQTASFKNPIVITINLVVTDGKLAREKLEWKNVAGEAYTAAGEDFGELTETSTSTTDKSVKFLLGLKDGEKKITSSDLGSGKLIVGLYKDAAGEEKISAEDDKVLAVAAGGSVTAGLADVTEALSTWIDYTVTAEQNVEPGEYTYYLIAKINDAVAASMPIKVTIEAEALKNKVTVSGVDNDVADWTAAASPALAQAEFATISQGGTVSGFDVTASVSGWELDTKLAPGIYADEAGTTASSLFTVTPSQAALTHITTPAESAKTENAVFTVTPSKSLSVGADQTAYLVLKDVTTKEVGAVVKLIIDVKEADSYLIHAGYTKNYVAEVNDTITKITQTENGKAISGAIIELSPYTLGEAGSGLEDRLTFANGSNINTSITVSVGDKDGAAFAPGSETILLEETTATPTQQASKTLSFSVNGKTLDDAGTQSLKIVPNTTNITEAGKVSAYINITYSNGTKVQIPVSLMVYAGSVDTKNVTVTPSPAEADVKIEGSETPVKAVVIPDGVESKYTTNLTGTNKATITVANKSSKPEEMVQGLKAVATGDITLIDALGYKADTHEEISVEAGKSYVFTVVPKTNLTQGLHTGTVTVSATNVDGGTTLKTYTVHFNVSATKDLTIDTYGKNSNTLAAGYAERLYATLANPDSKTAKYVVSIDPLTSSSAKAILNLNGKDLKEGEGNVTVTFTVSGGKATGVSIQRTAAATAASATIVSTNADAFSKVTINTTALASYKVNDVASEVAAETGINTWADLSKLRSAGVIYLPSEDDEKFSDFDEYTKVFSTSTDSKVLFNVWVPTGSTVAKTLGVSSLEGKKAGASFLKWFYTATVDGKATEVEVKITDALTDDVQVAPKFHTHTYPSAANVTDDMWKWVGPDRNGNYKVTLTLECTDAECPGGDESTVTFETTAKFVDAVPGPYTGSDEINYYRYTATVVADAAYGGATYTNTKEIDNTKKNGHTWNYTITWPATIAADTKPAITATDGTTTYQYRDSEIEVAVTGHSCAAAGNVLLRTKALNPWFMAGESTKFLDTYIGAVTYDAEHTGTRTGDLTKVIASAAPHTLQFVKIDTFAGTESNPTLSGTKIVLTCTECGHVYNAVDSSDTAPDPVLKSIKANGTDPETYTIVYTYNNKDYTVTDAIGDTSAQTYINPVWSNWSYNTENGTWETYLTLTAKESQIPYTVKGTATGTADANGFFVCSATAIDPNGVTYTKSTTTDVLIVDRVGAANVPVGNRIAKTHTSHNYSLKNWYWGDLTANVTGISLALECSEGDITVVDGTVAGVTITSTATPEGSNSFLVTSKVTIASAITGNKVLEFTNSTSVSDLTAGQLTAKGITVTELANDSDIVSASIDADVADIVYTGKKVTPAVKVLWNDSILVEKTDYTVKYANNVNAGTATATITGKGQYSFTEVLTFEIQKADIANATVSQVVSKLGAKKLSNPTVKYNGKSLKFGKDFAFSDASEWNNATEKNTYVEIQGIGTNFEGTADAKLVVYDGKNSIPASKLTVKVDSASLAAFAKTEDAVNGRNLVYKVYYGKTLLAQDDGDGNLYTAGTGTDYAAALEVVNNSNTAYKAGAGVLTINVVDDLTVPAGKSTKKVVGSKDQKYTIKSAKFSKTDFSVLNKKSVPYTGKAYGLDDVLNTLGIEVDDLAPGLTYGDDYTAAITNNLKKGNMTITFNGAGMYAGSKVSKKIKIDGATDMTVYLAGHGQYVAGDVVELPFTQGGAKFASNQIYITALANDYVLREGVDYTVSYKNNKKVGQAGVMTIKGKGSYGTIKVNFTVVKNDEPAIYVTPQEVVSTKLASALKKTPAVYDAVTGKKISNKDFTVQWQNTTPDSDGYCYAYINFNGGTSGKYAGGEEVIAIHTYTNKIKSKDFTQKTNKKYQGTPVNITVDDFNGPKDSAGDASFEIISVKNNIKAGKATVVVRGTGAYGGTATLKYTIGKSNGENK